MELAGFILLFVGLVYAVMPDLNLRLYPKDNPVVHGKIKRGEYIKTIRIISAVAIFIGGALLVASFFI
ncbi:MAG: hypothetical protein GXC73_07000 [Chitinophagaceae bacterium]|nr:hypothetical protein [Chitinophagaceae bacterium]